VRGQLIRRQYRAMNKITLAAADDKRAAELAKP
jgi:hypothetical protein